MLKYVRYVNLAAVFLMIPVIKHDVSAIEFDGMIVLADVFLLLTNGVLFLFPPRPPK
jgi:hypothetical protein